MNVLSTKLSLIEWLFQLKDEGILWQLEIFRNETKKARGKPLHPMSLDTFYKKIEASEKAFKNGKVTSQRDLRKEIKSCKNENSVEKELLSPPIIS